MKQRQPIGIALALVTAALIGWLLLHSRPIPGPVPGEQPQRLAALSSPADSATPRLAEDHAKVTDDSAQRPASTTAVTPPSSAPMSSRDAGPTPAAPTAENGATNVPPPAGPPSESATVNAIRARRMITDYHTLAGENPVGTNAEIMAAVMGRNRRQATVGPPDGMTLNASGELLDDWGTPYFFHQLSKDVMEIHSAGPDKVMGTADDIVVR